MFDDVKEQAEGLIEDHKDEVVDAVKDKALEQVAENGLEGKLTSLMGDKNDDEED